MGLVHISDIDISNIDGDVVVQDWGAPGRAAYIPGHVRTAIGHVMLASQVQGEVQWAMCDVQGHVTCRVAVEVDRCVEVQSRNWNVFCGVLYSHVGLQMPQMRVIHHKESMVQRPVEKCDIQCKPILDLVGLVAGAVEVERCYISRHIHSDIDSLGDGDVDIIDRGKIRLIGTNADIPAVHLFSAVNCDVAEILPFEECSGGANSNDSLVRVLVWLGEVGLHFKVRQQRIGSVEVDGEVGRAGKREEWSGFVVPGHWYGDVGTKVHADELGAVKDVRGANSSLKLEEKKKRQINQFSLSVSIPHVPLDF